jgi:Cof subfamily protein (haloacid dehalogenase superfamily)
MSLTAAELLKLVPAVALERLVFAVDVDKTITRLDSQVSPRTEAAIQAVFAAGGSVSLCTGRGYLPLQDKILKYFPPQSVHVVAGGAQLIKQNGERLWGQEMPGSLVTELVAKALTLGCNYGFGLGKDFYANTRMTGHLTKAFSLMSIISSDTAPQLTTEAVPVLVVTQINDQMKQVLKQYEAVISYKLVSDYNGNEHADITAKNVTKALGLQKLADYYQIAITDLVTAGDASNDLEMIEASWGVAMGNAIDELKSKAKLVIGHTDDDGLAEFLETMLAASQLHKQA